MLLLLLLVVVVVVKFLNEILKFGLGFGFELSSDLYVASRAAGVCVVRCIFSDTTFCEQVD